MFDQTMMRVKLKVQMAVPPSHPLTKTSLAYFEVDMILFCARLFYDYLHNCVHLLPDPRLLA